MSHSYLPPINQNIPDDVRRDALTLKRSMEYNWDTRLSNDEFVEIYHGAQPLIAPRVESLYAEQRFVQTVANLTASFMMASVAVGQDLNTIFSGVALCVSCDLLSDFLTHRKIDHVKKMQMYDAIESLQCGPD